MWIRDSVDTFWPLKSLCAAKHDCSQESRRKTRIPKDKNSVFNSNFEMKV